MQNLEEEILRQLARGDAFACQLFDAVRPSSYQELWIATARLQKDGKIRAYFSGTYPSPTLTFGLQVEEKKVVPWSWR